MRCDFLVEAVGNIDPAIIDEAENYIPKRKSHAWIWAAASAACLCFAVMIIFSRSVDRINTYNCLKGQLAAVPVHGYVDYRETAEKGKVTITDELKAQLDECNEPPVLFGTDDMCGWIFSVHITDADGAGRFHLYKNCLEPLNLGEGNVEDFLRDGTLMLTKKQIYSLKCPPTCTVIIAPSMIFLDKEYLDTVTLDKIDVRVYQGSWNYALGDDLNEQDGLDREIRRIKEFFDKYANDNKIPRESITEYSESTGVFRARLDKETISRLLADERTEMVCMITDG